MVDNSSQRAHRLAWFYCYGEWPSDQLDHINRIKTDNRIDNLRESSAALNQQNLSKMCSNTSGFTGVTWNKRRNAWIAQIGVGNSGKYLGQFADVEDAVAARKAGELKYWGANRA
jgi:hypothetical protein